MAHRSRIWDLLVRTSPQIELRRAWLRGVTELTSPFRPHCLGCWEQMRCALSPASAPGERPPAQTTPAPPSLPPPPPASPTRRRLQPPPLPLWQRVSRAIAPDAQAYMQGLGQLAPTARPSALQPLAQRRSAVCAPRPAVDGTQLADLPVDGVGQLLPVNGGVAQCHLELGPVKGVPPSGKTLAGCCRWLHV